MKALTLRAPWWHAIFAFGKDVENRGWSTDYRGPLAIHAGLWWNLAEVASDFKTCRAVAFRQLMRGDGAWPPATPEPWKEFILDVCEAADVYRGSRHKVSDLRCLGGCVLGVVDVVGVARDEHPSPWFAGPCGLILANPRPIYPVGAVRGRLNLFDLDAATTSEVEAALQESEL